MIKAAKDMIDNAVAERIGYRLRERLLNSGGMVFALTPDEIAMLESVV